MLSSTNDVFVNNYKYPFTNLMQQAILAFFANNETYVQKGSSKLPSLEVSISEMPDPIGISNSIPSN